MLTNTAARFRVTTGADDPEVAEPPVDLIDPIVDPAEDLLPLIVLPLIVLPLIVLPLDFAVLIMLPPDLLPLVMFPLMLLLEPDVIAALPELFAFRV